MPTEPPATGWVFPDVAGAAGRTAAPTTWSARAPTWSRARCWRPTARACSRCPADPLRRARRALLWWSPVERGVLPLDGLRVSRSLRQAVRRMEVRVDTAFDEVIWRRAPTRPARAPGSTSEMRRGLHPAARAGLGALRRGVAGRRAGRRPVRRRGRRPLRGRVDVPPGDGRLQGGAGRRWSTCCATSTPTAGCSTCSGAPTTSPRLGVVTVPRPAYLEMLRGRAGDLPAPRRLPLTRARAGRPGPEPGDRTSDDLRAASRSR